MAETRPISTPHNEQLEELTTLTNSARGRARERHRIHKKIQDIMDQKEDMMPANPYWCYAYRDQLANLDRELASLDRQLNHLRAQEKRDATKERELWNQVVWGFPEGGTDIAHLTASGG